MMQRIFHGVHGLALPRLVGVTGLGADWGRDARLRGLVEAFCSHAHDLLATGCPQQGQWRAAAACLGDRGFDLAMLDCLPLGLLVSPVAMKQSLIDAGFAPEEICESKLLADQRLAGRLVGPIADPRGRIVSLWARHPDGRRPRYLYWRGRWKHEVPAIGLETALAAAEAAGGQIVLVEDPLDALLMQSKGLLNTAAVGKSARGVSRQQWEGMARAGVRRAILVLDRDETWHSRMAASLASALSAKAAPAIFVLPPEKLGAAAGPGQLVRCDGPDALRSILAAAGAAAPVRASAGGYCALHDCPETECFCFD